MASAVDLTRKDQQIGEDIAHGSSDPTTGPAPYHYYYTFGDLVSGKMSAAKANAQQNIADYYEWVRNESSAQRQRDYETWLDSTKVQRAMQDIQAAGLNPWLALQSAGFGGSVPSGAAASSSAGQVNAGGGSNLGATIGATAASIALMIKLVSKFLG